MKHTHTSAFAHFGTVPRNVQWSWSARNEETKTVVVTLWQDEFTSRDGVTVYERPALHRQVRSRHGYPEMMDNLAWAQANCAGRLRVIVAIAKDPQASPRSIKECFPSKLVMRLTHVDSDTGAFTAVADGS